MALRDELRDLVDEVREDIIDTEVGLRLFTVSTRLRTWSGSRPGAGTATDTDTVLSPKPKVIRLPLRVVESSGGRFEAGDLAITKLSAQLADDALDGGTLAANEEWFILVDGAPHRVVSKVEQRYLEKRIIVRRVKGR